jgi:hypothetical protein
MGSVSANALNYSVLLNNQVQTKERSILDRGLNHVAPKTQAFLQYAEGMLGPNSDN